MSSNLYTFGSIQNLESYSKYSKYSKYVTLNNDDISTVNVYSFNNVKLLTQYPTEKPTEFVSPSIPPLLYQQNNCTCVFKTDLTNKNNILIIVTSITSSLCAVLFFLLIWYKFIFKKNLLKWHTNDYVNFGFGYNET